MRPFATVVAGSLCLSVGRKREPYKNGRTDPRNHMLSGGPGFLRGNWQFWGSCPPMKCIGLCKQQTPRQHGAADLSVGDSESRRMRSFKKWTRLKIWHQMASNLLIFLRINWPQCVKSTAKFGGLYPSVEPPLEIECYIDRWPKRRVLHHGQHLSEMNFSI